MVLQWLQIADFAGLHPYFFMYVCYLLAVYFMFLLGIHCFHFGVSPLNNTLHL